MKVIHRLFIGLILITALQLTACAPSSPKQEKVKPANVVKVDGSEYSQVVLTEKAYERLGIQIEYVTNEVISRTHNVAAEVVDPTLFPNVTIGPGQALVKVFVSEADLNDIDQEEGAVIVPLDLDDEAEGFDAEFLSDVVGDREDADNDDDYLLFVVDNDEANLVIGQRVIVELERLNSGKERKVVPYAAVIYGVKGETWVYTSPEPLVYIRQPIVIDYIEDNAAVLTDGPEYGTAVVTVGVAELYGTETGVSK